VTTVGYGDVTPQAASGRAIAAFVMLEGIAFLAILTAAITSTFVARAERERAAEDAAEAGEKSELDEIAARLDRIEAALQELAER
jgi:voltage-gated potassium channel Kch